MTGAPPADAPEVAPDRGVRARVRHLRIELLVAGGLVVLAGVLGLIFGGPVAAAGAIAGVGLVTASYTASTLAIAWADSIAPRMVFGVGMAMYVTKFSLFGALLIFVGGSDWSGRIPMAIGIVAGVVGWTGAQIWWTVHHEHPYVRI